MILCLDVGNTQVYCGVFQEEKLIVDFRFSNRGKLSSDELGIFMKNALRENNIAPEMIRHISMCSVVPNLLHTISSACIKYFQMKPFILRSGVKTGLNIKYRNPREVGTDRIANAIGATKYYPQKNLIIIDFGTATTFCAVSKDKEYLGGLILPGPRLMMDVLQTGTAQLPSVEIKKPPELVGRSTVESIQSGLYFGNKAIIKEISSEIKKEYFQSETETLVIGTGGFSKLYEKEKIFDVFRPALVLEGLYQALEMNT